MFNSKKIAAAAGVVGGFALLGVGAVQGFAADGSGGCVDDGKGSVRCVQVTEYHMTVDKGGNVHVVNDSTQSCPSSQSEVSCVNAVELNGKKS
ncbi:hypothetical protein [Streptomyces sp. NPDC003697]